MTQQTEGLGYIILVAISIPFGNHDPYWWISTAICVLAAYSLRIMGDIRDKDFTWSSAGVQFVTTVSLDTIAYYVWKDNKGLREYWIFSHSFQIYIFQVSYFSFAIVTILNKMGKYGIDYVWSIIVAKISASKDTTPPTPPMPKP